MEQQTMMKTFVKSHEVTLLKNKVINEEHPKPFEVTDVKGTNLQILFFDDLPTAKKYFEELNGDYYKGII